MTKLTISIDNDSCTRCGKCTKVCPSKILFFSDHTATPQIGDMDTCIKCGHCVDVCESRALKHSLFPDQKIHTIDRSQLPTSDQMMLLCKTRRSNRAFSTKTIPLEKLRLIVEAANAAPTGSNQQNVEYVIITDPQKLRAVSQFTIGVFEGMLKKLKNPLLRPIIKMASPDAMRYIPIFERIKADFDNGGDQILRKANALILIHTPRNSRFGITDANLAYQNGSLMAESLGISQFYTGFVLNASRMKKGQLESLLDLESDREINAGMALGVPLFQYANYTDRGDVIAHVIEPR